MNILYVFEGDRMFILKKLTYQCMKEHITKKHKTIDCHFVDYTDIDVKYRIFYTFFYFIISNISHCNLKIKKTSLHNNDHLYKDYKTSFYVKKK